MCKDQQRKRRMTRREFFRRGTLGLAGGLAFPYVVRSSALGKAGTVSPSERITMGRSATDRGVSM